MFRILKKFALIISASALVIGGLSGCSGGDATPDEVTVVTHDSVVFTDEVIKAFKDETGITIKQIKAGDAGAMTNKLVLTKDVPIGDAFFGIDNTFSGVAMDNEIVDGAMEPVDYGDVCFNYDKTWFTNHEQAAPETIKDLTKPEFKGLTVVENPSTSSTGLSFLIATVGAFGADKWTKYWEDLKANDVRIDAGWEEAYNVNFSGSAGKGNYPIVLSYSSSPAFEENTASIDDGCFRQTEYAGLLTGGSQVDGAKKFIDFLLSDSFQKTIPDSMYMYPVSTKVALPEAWSTKAPAASNAISVDSKQINANRSTWLKAWDAIFKN